MYARLSLVGFVVSLATLTAAEPAPAPRPVPTDAFGDPLPRSAKLRLGAAAFRSPYSMRPPAASPDGQWIAFASDVGGGYQVLRSSTGRVEREFAASGSALELVGFSANSRRLAAWGTGDRGIGAELHVWDLATGNPVGKQDLLQAIHRRESVSLSGDGRLAAGIQATGTPQHLLAKVCEVESGKEILSVRLLANQVGYLSLSNDGTHLATWGNYHSSGKNPYVNDAGERPDQIVQLWDVATGKETIRIQPSSFYARTAAFSPDGKHFVTGGDPVELWDAVTGKLVRTFVGRKYQGKALAFSPDGKTLAGVAHAHWEERGSGWVNLWEVESGRRTASCLCSEGTPLGAVFPATGPPIAFGQDGQAVRLWQLPDGLPLTPATGHTDRVVALAFAADDRTLLSVGMDNRVLRWDTATGRQLAQIPLNGGNRNRGDPTGSQETRSAVLLAGGKRLVTNYWRGGVTVYDLANGHEEFTLHSRVGQEVQDQPAAVSPDGSRIASFSRSRMGNHAVVMVWDAATGSTILERKLPSLSEVSVGFTADGSRVVASAAKTGAHPVEGYEIAAWEVATGKALGRADFVRLKHPVRLSAGPNARSVMVDLGDGEVAVWDAIAARTVHSINGAFPSGKREGYVVSAGATPTVSPDGRLVAVGAHSPLPLNQYLPRDGIVRVVELATGRVTHEFIGHRSIITALAFSSNGQSLASGSQDATVMIWNLAAASAAK